MHILINSRGLFVTEMTSGNSMSSDIGDKYKAVLNALIDQNYNVMNDVYLDMFISHISGKTGEGMNNCLKTLSIFDYNAIHLHSTNQISN